MSSPSRSAVAPRSASHAANRAVTTPTTDGEAEPDNVLRELKLLRHVLVKYEAQPMTRGPVVDEVRAVRGEIERLG
jgi:hypothetical protein